MRISKIILENFRCFQKAEIEFHKFHALVGENGSGKTSVLEAINLATSSGMSYLTEQDFNNNDSGNLKIEVFFNEPFLVKIPDGYTSQDIPCQSVVLEAHRREKSSAGRVLSDPFVVEKTVSPLIYTGGFSSTIESLTGNIPDSVKKTDKGYEAPRKSGKAFTFTKQRLSIQNDLVNFPEVFYFDRKREDESKIGFNSLLTKVAKDLNWQYRKNWNQTDIVDKWQIFYENKIVYERAEDIETFTKSFESLLGISSKSDHKASRALSAIDEIAPDKIPQEIKTVIKKIADWGKLA